MLSLKTRVIVDSENPRLSKIHGNKGIVTRVVHDSGPAWEASYSVEIDGDKEYIISEEDLIVDRSAYLPTKYK